MNDMFSDTVFSVRDLTTLIKTTLEGSFYGLTVEGEISNFRPASSGHWYFQLNDREAAIQAVMFKQRTWRLPFVPKDGDAVTVTGNISVYEKRGTYQIICESMIRSGTGDILAMLEARKREFAETGYFDQSLKRPLPRFPRRIGVVTSPTGAAVQDILQVLERRNRAIDVIVLPAPVQGEGAASIIAAQIRAANRLRLADVLIVGRGGGSLEDLLPFSERCVIEAIVDSAIPVVSAVGHEIDWALSDYAADLRAPTPSAAAELVSMDRTEILALFSKAVGQMADIVGNRITAARGKTALFTPRLMADYFGRRIEGTRLRADDAREQMGRAITERLRANRHDLTVWERQMEALSPLAVLKRGYAIVTRMTDKSVVTDARMVAQGDEVSVRLSKGSITALVGTIAPGSQEADDGIRRGSEENGGDHRPVEEQRHDTRRSDQTL